MKRLMSPVVAVALITLVSACKKVERIEVEPKTVAFTEAGKKEALKATAVTADGQPVEGVKFEFSSSDPQVVTVDGNGTVVAVKSGSASVEIKGSEKSAKVPVEVSIPAAIVVKGTPITLTGLGTTATVDAQVQDDAGRPVQGAAVELGSADTNIVEVSGNTVTAKGVGTTTVTATSGALRQQVEVTVKLPAVASVTIEEAPTTLKVGQSVALKVATKAADGAAIAGVTPTFTSSNEKLATVDATGNVKAVKPGAVTITAKSGDKTDNAKITIKKK
ncbi:Ig-like domain-containing protein [Hyalangium sp.]|uniref:Ig-like domain-containing protein n=1 Tax=Hyalangium sp. TaxID=2028555 RepID=UPI002D3C99D2|nr:Ig-like domain-containing protein [Hyalangium sp.]HYH99170.1 Ig-like domain-containing protein [Hyalangium sp.]